MTLRNGCRARRFGPDESYDARSASEIHDWHVGHAYWLPANPPGTHHQDVNVGDKPIEVTPRKPLPSPPLSCS